VPQLALALTTVIWAATFPATKLALEQVLPLSFLFLRFLISSLVLVAVLILARRPIGRTTETLRTAAIAPVSGTNVTSVQNSCSPSRHVPVLYIHGTADGVVAYDGTTGIASAADLMDLW